MSTNNANDSSAFAPFRNRAFAWLWLGVLVSSTGAWAQTVGAQWLFVNDPNGATIVSLVQSATMLPMMLLALPGGVLSDAFDRRWLLLTIQCYFIIVALTLAVLSVLGAMPAWLLLAFTFAIGIGTALQLPTWQPLITELVPRSQFAAASRLDMVNVNVSRAIGPAIAGVIIGIWGVPPVFFFNVGCVAVLAVILILWRRPAKVRTESREHFLPALEAGARYVRHELRVRRLMVRLAIFLVPASALWALLPLIANQRLGLSASGYGLLFTALGAGAVLGALSLGRLRQRVSANRLIVGSTVLYAAALALTMVAPGLLGALPLLTVAGFSWTAIASTLISELQLLLPGWVRARALAAYLTVFAGIQAVAAPAWGMTTQHFGLPVAVFAAAILLVVSAVAGVPLKLPDARTADPTPLNYWTDTPLLHEVEPDGGPVQVMVEFEVPKENEANFLAAMHDLRRSRMRTGAFRWELYRVGERPGNFLEIFAVPSWEEHERQHTVRMTAADQALEEAAFRYVTGTPKSQHLLPPESQVGLPPSVDLSQPR